MQKTNKKTFLILVSTVAFIALQSPRGWPKTHKRRIPITHPRTQPVMALIISMRPKPAMIRSRDRPG